MLKTLFSCLAALLLMSAVWPAVASAQAVSDDEFFEFNHSAMDCKTRSYAYDGSSSNLLMYFSSTATYLTNDEATTTRSVVCPLNKEIRMSSDWAIASRASVQFTARNSTGNSYKVGCEVNSVDDFGSIDSTLFTYTVLNNGTVEDPEILDVNGTDLENDYWYLHCAIPPGARLYGYRVEYEY